MKILLQLNIEVKNISDRKVLFKLSKKDLPPEFGISNMYFNYKAIFPNEIIILKIHLGNYAKTNGNTTFLHLFGNKFYLGEICIKINQMNAGIEIFDVDTGKNIKSLVLKYFDEYQSIFVFL